MDSDVKSGMQNRSVYPKSTQDEAHFPLICSIDIPCSTAYSASGLTSLGNFPQEIPWDTRLHSIWILISVQQLGESSMHPISSKDESWFPVFDWRFEPTFHQHLKWSFPSATGVRGTLCFLSQVEWTARDPDWKEGRISLQCLKFRLVFHLTRWRDVWIPCGDHRESDSSPSHLESGNHITLIPREAHGIQGFKRWWWLTLFENG